MRTICCSFLAMAVLPALQIPLNAGQSGAPARTASAQPAPPGNAQNGKKIFAAYGCYECHGYEGQGGSAGARLAPRPIAFAAFSKYVRHPTNQMPPYTTKVVTEQELADIYAYLQSIPVPPPAKSIPQLETP
jgi:mono/diheme cytochrome c family protein